MPEQPKRSSNVVWQAGELTREDRWRALGAPGGTVWFTGLPASGKSSRGGGGGGEAARRPGTPPTCSTATTCATASTATSPSRARTATENVRRTAEVAALLADAGTVALVSLVSPFAADRAAARAVHERNGLRFLEVWVSTPLEECERRDPKGLYAKARAGELPDFTGVGQPYEEPASPDLEIQFGEGLEGAAERVLSALRS